MNKQQLEETTDILCNFAQGAVILEDEDEGRRW